MDHSKINVTEASTADARAWTAAQAEPAPEKRTLFVLEIPFALSALGIEEESEDGIVAFYPAFESFEEAKALQATCAASNPPLYGPIYKREYVKGRA